jgi:endonuclease/exonuclease/phosphatase family metal-dependent hydrolase
MYLYNLFFADYNAYDLGMINRTFDNTTLPKGYTDKGIIENHRWIDSGKREDQSEDWRSIRKVVDRHQTGVWHRMLWQNVKLISTSGILGARRNRAEEFGKRFGSAGFDIIGMCELPSKNLLKHVRQGYDESHPDTDQEWAPKDLGVLIGRRSEEENAIKRNITHAESKQFENTGPFLTGPSKEGWLRVVIEVPPITGSPKFEVFVTHFQPVTAGNVDAKLQTKIDQMRELANEIQERNREKPQHPKILLGDLNIHSGGRGKGFSSDEFIDDDSGVAKGQYFSNLMQQMHSVGMQDAWLTYGGPGPANKECSKIDGYLCDPFNPENKDYFCSSRIDYAFIEEPRPDHALQIDVSRTKMTGWEKSSGSGYLSDHIGIAFDILTSPAGSNPS